MVRSATTCVLLLGCASPADPAHKAPDSGRPTAWTDPAADDDWSHLIDPIPQAVPLGRADVEAALNAALGAGIPTMGEVVSRYYDLLAQGDDVCPGSAFVGGFEVFGTCTAESGVVFSGVAGIDITDERVFDGEAWTSGRYALRTSPADYAITRPDGTMLVAGGFLSFWREPTGGIDVWSSIIEGSWQDSGATGWLGDGISSNLEVRGQADHSTPRGFQLHGSYTPGAVSLDFGHLLVAPALCAGAVQSGNLSIRLSGGQVATVQFEECSPCGTATLDDGQTLGEVCIDTTPLEEAIELSGWIP